MPKTTSHPLTHRATTAAAVVLLAVQAAFSCEPVPARITIASPLPGATVTGCSLLVRVELSADIDPTSLEVTLNFEPIALSQAAPGQPYETTVDATFGALRFAAEGDNLLLVRGTRLSDGVTMTAGSAFTFGGFVRAFQITDAADLMEGPLAHGRVGDYMLENCIARFIIQDVGQRDMYSVGDRKSVV